MEKEINTTFCLNNLCIAATTKSSTQACAFVLNKNDSHKDNGYDNL